MIVAGQYLRFRGSSEIPTTYMYTGTYPPYLSKVRTSGWTLLKASILEVCRLGARPRSLWIRTLMRSLSLKGTSLLNSF